MNWGTLTWHLKLYTTIPTIQKLVSPLPITLTLSELQKYVPVRTSMNYGQNILWECTLYTYMVIMHAHPIAGMYFIHTSHPNSIFDYIAKCTLLAISNSLI